MNNISIFLKDIKSKKSFSYNKEFNRVAKLHKYWSRKPWYIIEKYISVLNKICKQHPDFLNQLYYLAMKQSDESSVYLKVY